MCHALYVSTTTDARTFSLIFISTSVGSDAASATSATPNDARPACLPEMRRMVNVWLRTCLLVAICVIEMRWKRGSRSIKKGARPVI